MASRVLVLVATPDRGLAAAGTASRPDLPVTTDPTGALLPLDPGRRVAGFIRAAGRPGGRGGHDWGKRHRLAPPCAARVGAPAHTQRAHPRASIAGCRRRTPAIPFVAQSFSAPLAAEYGSFRRGPALLRRIFPACFTPTWTSSHRRGVPGTAMLNYYPWPALSHRDALAGTIAADAHRLGHATHSWPAADSDWRMGSRFTRNDCPTGKCRAAERVASIEVVR